MSWLLTIFGIAALIVIHEGGHALAAKAMGMRVERFALFFPPIIWSRKFGNTDIALGSIPLGGYVKITGQNAAEEVSLEDSDVSYANKAIWRRAVVIAAGPAANLLTCLLLVTALLALDGKQSVTTAISSAPIAAPAAGILQRGDRVISVDGVGGSPEALVRQTRSHSCAGTPVNGCRASTPVVIKVVRAGSPMSFTIKPRWDSTAAAMRLGFAFDTERKPVAFGTAVKDSGTASWQVTTATLKAISGVADSQQRKQLGGIVGGVAVTQQAFSQSLFNALELLAFISLSIAIVNLLPILPLDGGHLFWLLIEKIRGKKPSTETLEKAALIGFALVAVLFVIGLSNDVGRLASGGFSRTQ